MAKKDKNEKLENGKKEKKKILKSDKVRINERNIKILEIGLISILLLLIIMYFFLKIIYEEGPFTVSLDENLMKKNGIILFENLNEKDPKRILKADTLKFIDNISINWLPDNLNELGEGSHNGENYIAYTFYIENQGSDTINYWYTIFIDDVIKNVDNAIRVMVYRNDERKIYAKMNANGNPEEGTVAFYSDDKVLMESRKQFASGDIDKFTIVIWIEGDDPDCVDALIGGEMKMHMELVEEHIN